MERIWGEMDMPAGQEGYAELVSDSEGRWVAVIVTSTSLTDARRTQVRAELLGLCLSAATGAALGGA